MSKPSVVLPAIPVGVVTEPQPTATRRSKRKADEKSLPTPLVMAANNALVMATAAPASPGEPPAKKQKQSPKKRFSCLQASCLKTFATQSELKRHCRVHTGERPFECGICRKTFSRNSSLARHMRTHTGDKPYVCEHCKRAFSDRTHLLAHTRTHTGDKPYKCKQCDKSFRVSSGLRRHARVHSGEKPYECTHCNLKFRFNSGLQRHVRIHTGEKRHECQGCKKRFHRIRDVRVHHCASKLGDALVAAEVARLATGQHPAAVKLVTPGRIAPGCNPDVSATDVVSPAPLTSNAPPAPLLGVVPARVVDSTAPTPQLPVVSLATSPAPATAPSLPTLGPPAAQKQVPGAP